MPTTKKQNTRRTGFTGQAIDGCSEAAMRLLVVERMLYHHDCPVVPPARHADEDKPDDGGFDITMAAELVEGIRELLLDAAENERAMDDEKGGA